MKLNRAIPNKAINCFSKILQSIGIGIPISGICECLVIFHGIGESVSVSIICPWVASDNHIPPVVDNPGVQPFTSIPSRRPSPSVSGDRGSVDLPSTAPSPSRSLALNSSRFVNLSSSSTTIIRSCSLLETSSPTLTLM